MKNGIPHTLLLAACILLTPVLAPAAGQGGFEAAFEQRFMEFCTSGAQEEVNVTPQSAIVLCRCLYDYAVELTAQEVKQSIIDLPGEATVRDFDGVYVHAYKHEIMDKAVVDAITREYVRCVDTYGVRLPTDGDTQSK